MDWLDALMAGGETLDAFNAAEAEKADRNAAEFRSKSCAAIIEEWTRAGYVFDGKCKKCHGAGHLGQFNHVQNGVCFGCFGTGTNAKFVG